MRITLWLVVGAVAAVLCVSRPVHAEPHGDMPSGWSLEPAADEPPATIEQEPEMRIDELKDLAADVRAVPSYSIPVLRAQIERLVAAISHVEPAVIVVVVPAPPAPPVAPVRSFELLAAGVMRRREDDFTRSWH